MLVEALEGLPAAVAAAVAFAIPAPEVHVEAPDAPEVDWGPLVREMRSLAQPVDVDALARSIGGVVADAMAAGDPSAALREVVEELSALRKKINSVARGPISGGGGGSAAEVRLQTADKEFVGAENPLPVIEGVVYDLMTATYPNSTTEVFTKTLDAVVVETTTVTYTNATKALIDTVAIVR